MPADPKQSGPTAERREELLRMKAAKWPEQGREERIARAQAAWAQSNTLVNWNLPAEIWRQIGEDPDLEYD